jgi:hypothetical protein
MFNYEPFQAQIRHILSKLKTYTVLVLDWCVRTMGPKFGGEEGGRAVVSPNYRRPFKGELCYSFRKRRILRVPPMVHTGCSI